LARVCSISATPGAAKARAVAAPMPLAAPVMRMRLAAMIPPMFSAWLDGDFADKFFDVKDDVGYIFTYAWYGRELMQHTFNFDGGYGSTLQ
jgi:hypothetical protein